jgi:hypothetical protein
MTKRGNLGQILRDLGRITGEEQEAALAYQKEHGGFFGEALIALEFLTAEELEFGLASQFDLPYVFPDPDAIDRDVAYLVSPEWALTNMALPISRTEETLVVVVDSPLKDGVREELGARTGLEVELAIASPDRIRRLVRELFSVPAGESGATPVVDVEVFLARVFDDGEPSFGLSIRGRIAVGWWGTERVVLAAGWARALRDRLTSARDLHEVSEEAWADGLVLEGREVPVRVRVLGSGREREALFSLPEAEAGEDLPEPPASFRRDLRILVERGSPRFGVRIDGGDPEALLAALPRLALGRQARSVHLSPNPEGEGLRMGLPESPEELETLKDFRFDVLTLYPDEAPERWIRQLAPIRSACFVHMAGSELREAFVDAGVRWEIEIREEDGEWSWRLFPINPTH